MTRNRVQKLSAYLWSGFQGEALLPTLVSYLVSILWIVPLLLLVRSALGEGIALKVAPLIIIGGILGEMTLCKRLSQTKETSVFGFHHYTKLRIKTEKYLLSIYKHISSQNTRSEDKPKIVRDALHAGLISSGQETEQPSPNEKVSH